MKLDVAILGGGMGGSLIARQLSRQVPGLSIGIFEKNTETSYKVGESTVEIAGSYLNRRVGLSRYLYEHHLPKNGLRFFFDDAEKQAELTEMSEIGTISLPFHPAFQVDRARLDADLLVMNEKAGIAIHTGTRVDDLEIGQGGASHSFRIERDGHKDRVECRWLLDASGRAALVSRALDLRVEEANHSMLSVWGRFEGVADVDDCGDPAFSARARHTARGISTMHFCYPDYWIWVIPLGAGITSIGVVGQPPGKYGALCTQEGFRAFLESHRAMASLLTHAKPIDVVGLNGFTYGTRQFFSADRWGLIGEAGAFPDPLYSPGADFIALANDFLCDLVKRDQAGEANDEQARRAQLYDRFMAFRFEAAMRLYRGLYGLIGSFDLMRMKWDFDIGCYFNLWVSPYFLDEYLDEGFLRSQLRQQRFILQALQNFSDLFRAAETRVRERGEYHCSNLGVFSHGLENIDFIEQVGLPRSQQEIHEKTGQIFNDVRRRGLELLGREMDAQAQLPLTTMMTARPLF
ncbi:MAG: NAD(P)/FAD-dependent oxidoreductase [bacterium]|nr:NAD(P)/FAD-dependent oxidoreductase [bacterium]MCP5069898.1 NAD(P)/FAD-dependent oxidoreductase [bacterium]